MARTSARHLLRAFGCAAVIAIPALLATAAAAPAQAQISVSIGSSTISTAGSRPMAAGAIIRAGARSGIPGSRAIFAPITTAIGWTRANMAGCGSPTKVGATSPIIMAAGFMTRAKAGFGFPAMSGDRPGWCGVRVAAISAGFRCRQATTITVTAPIAAVSTTRMAIATGTDPVSATPSSSRSGSSSAKIISATAISTTMLCPSVIMAASSDRQGIRPTTPRSTITSSIAASMRTVCSRLPSSVSRLWPRAASFATPRW